MSELNFDANGVPPQQSFDPLPAGKYTAHVIESEIKETKAGTGHYLQLIWEVLDAPYQHRKLFDRLNIHNQNSTAQEIGQAQLSAVCHALGHLRVANSEELHGKPCRVRVKIRRDSGYEPQNEITGYEALDGAVPETAPASAPASAPAPAPAAGWPTPLRPPAPPWAAKTAGAGK